VDFEFATEGTEDTEDGRQRTEDGRPEAVGRRPERVGTASRQAAENAKCRRGNHQSSIPKPLIPDPYMKTRRTFGSMNESRSDLREFSPWIPQHRPGQGPRLPQAVPFRIK
jgi:hypothetical protein